MNDDDTRDQAIRERAYQIWEEAGQPDGQADQFWEQARAEIERDDGGAISEETADTLAPRFAGLAAEGAG